MTAVVIMDQSSLSFRGDAIASNPKPRDDNFCIPGSPTKSVVTDLVFIYLPNSGEPGFGVRASE
jgi:hypothetical protein